MLREPAVASSLGVAHSRPSRPARPVVHSAQQEAQIFARRGCQSQKADLRDARIAPPLHSPFGTPLVFVCLPFFPPLLLPLSSSFLPLLYERIRRMGTERQPIQAQRPVLFVRATSFPFAFILPCFLSASASASDFAIIYTSVPFASFVAAPKGKSPLLNIYIWISCILSTDHVISQRDFIIASSSYRRTWQVRFWRNGTHRSTLGV